MGRPTLLGFQPPQNSDVPKSTSHPFTEVFQVHLPAFGITRSLTRIGQGDEHGHFGLPEFGDGVHQPASGFGRKLGDLAAFGVQTALFPDPYLASFARNQTGPFPENGFWPDSIMPRCENMAIRQKSNPIPA